MKRPTLFKMHFNMMFCLLTFFFVSSCSTNFYVPNDPNLLTLSEKGDFKISGGVGTSLGDGSSLVSQIGYSPRKNIAIAGNYIAHEVFGELSDNVKGKKGEVGIGYYKFFPFSGEQKLAEANSNYEAKGILLDGYGGYGYGKSETKYNNFSSSRFNSQHYFIQAGIHTHNRIFGLSFIFRGVYLDIIKGKVIGDVPLQDYIDIQNLQDDPFILVESAMRMHVGKGPIKGFYTVNWVAPPLGNKTLSYRASSWHLGLTIDLDDLNKEAKSKKAFSRK